MYVCATTATTDPQVNPRKPNKRATRSMCVCVSDGESRDMAARTQRPLEFFGEFISPFLCAVAAFFMGLEGFAGCGTILYVHCVFGSRIYSAVGVLYAFCVWYGDRVAATDILSYL